MLSPRILGIAAVVALSVSHIACASTTLLASKETVDSKCAGEYAAIGLYCQRDDEPVPVIDPKAPGIPLLSGQTPFDPPSMRVAAILHLTTERTAAGFEYYTATTERFKTGIFNRDFEATDRFENEVWSFVTSSGLPVNDSSAAATVSFLAVNDARLQRKQAREAAENDRKVQVQAELDYENSPAGKKAAAARAVADCRRTISNAQHAIALDERAAKISGYENALLRQQAGITIVNCQDVIARGGYPVTQ